MNAQFDSLKNQLEALESLTIAAQGLLESIAFQLFTDETSETGVQDEDPSDCKHPKAKRRMIETIGQKDAYLCEACGHLDPGVER